MQRLIKSYVLRAGRVSTRQQQALSERLADYEIPFTADDQSPWDLSALFGRDAPTVVEIGFGMGASLAEMALAQPAHNFLGIEVHRAGLGSLAATLHEQAISNVRIVAHDAVDIIKYKLAPGSVSKIQIFFPDPWPKKRHHKRRLIQPAFISLLLTVLKKDGLIHCATDWQDYAEHMLEVLSQEPQLTNCDLDGTFHKRPSERPLTKFEKRGLKLGHGVWDLIFKNDR